MTSWRFHLFTGFLITVLLINICFITDLIQLFFHEDKIQYFYWFHICFVALLGSLLPDFDYRRTKIRHFLGLAIGLFLVISYLYLRRNELNKVDFESLLFVLIVIIVVTFLVGFAFPFRHHGKLHSGLAAILYALIWVVIEILFFDMTIQQAGLIGVFGWVGFTTHLILDRDLKWI